MRQSQLVASFALNVLALPLCVAAPIVTNGSFEADPFSASGTLGLGCGETLTGWSTGCSPDKVYPWGLKNSNVFNAGLTPYGQQWVIVGDFGHDQSYIQQSIDGFDVNGEYTLSFALATEGIGNVGSSVHVDFISGSSTAGQLFVAPVRGANFWDTWGTFSLNFVATAGSVTIRFTGLEDPIAKDAGIDNVQISGSATIPEPTTLLLAGLGLLLAARARRTHGSQPVPSL